MNRFVDAVIQSDASAPRPLPGPGNPRLTQRTRSRVIVYLQLPLSTVISPPKAQHGIRGLECNVISAK